MSDRMAEKEDADNETIDEINVGQKPRRRTCNVCVLFPVPSNPVVCLAFSIRGAVPRLFLMTIGVEEVEKGDRKRRWWPAEAR